MFGTKYSYYAGVHHTFLGLFPFWAMSLVVQYTAKLNAWMLLGILDVSIALTAALLVIHL